MSDDTAIRVDASGAEIVRPIEWNVEPPSRWELLALLSDEETAMTLERHLARVARAQGAVELAIAEGLVALCVDERAMRLGWSSLKDYGRERLHVRERTVLDLAHLARELRTRPLLRRAVRSGGVSIRKAQTILRVAVGEDEARWVALAREQTVRALEEAVRRATDPDAAEEVWDEMSVALAPEQRDVVDEALALAGKQLGPGSTRAQRVEALAQEWLGSHPFQDLGDEDLRIVGGSFRPLASRPAAWLERLKEQLERETERWHYLAEVEDVGAVEGGFDEQTDPWTIDARLKDLAAMRRGWGRQVGWLGLVVKRSRLWSLLGFASFAHYCSERLGLGVRTVEHRAALEQRLWEVPALRQAVEDGLSYEKARLVARCDSPKEMETWIARAEGMTVIALKRAMEADEDAQMRARRRLVVRMPRRISLLLAAAFEAVREVEGKPLSRGECLVRLAQHFIAVWKPLRKPRKTRSQEVRERDRGWCQVPGCSRPADDSHHVLFRSHGGGHERGNQVGMCKPHHLRGVHMGRVRVWGRAPDALVWELGERRGTVP